jgi:hypothetical protein
MTQNIYVAIDIEKTGSKMMQYSLVSIGVCVGNSEGVVLEKFKINVKVNWPTTSQSDVDYADY